MLRKTFVYFCCVLVTALAAACSSDPDTPLGASFVDDGLIGTETGAVSQDTITVDSGDTTFVTSSVLTKAASMSLGRKPDVETSPVVRFDFSDLGADTLKTVDSAVVRLTFDDQSVTDVLTAEFFELTDLLDELDPINVLNVGATPIPDGAMNTLRTMSVFPPTYPILPSLAQDWLTGAVPHNGIAVILNDTTTTIELAFSSRENVTSSERPSLTLFFSDGTDTRLDAVADGTFVNELTSTTHLRLSDGVTRRIFLPIALPAIGTETLLHNATFRLHIVPGTVSDPAGNLTASLYVPADSIIGSTGFLAGTDVETVFFAEDGTIEFPARSILADLIAGTVDNNGFVMQYTLENTSTRRIEFYGSSAVDSLRPSLTFTSSEAPDFP